MDLDKIIEQLNKSEPTPELTKFFLGIILQLAADIHSIADSLESLNRKYGN
jgi:hypothetical protein